jgi:hypothetical protein
MCTLFILIGTTGLAQIESWHYIDSLFSSLTYSDLENSILSVNTNTDYGDAFVNSATAFISDEDQSIYVICDDLVYKGIQNDSIIFDKLDYITRYKVDSKSFDYAKNVYNRPKDSMDYAIGMLLLCDSNQPEKLHQMTFYVPVKNPVFSTLIGTLEASFQLTVKPSNNLSASLIK